MALVALVCAKGADAAVTLTNGSFEATGITYLAALGDLKEASGWINLTPGSGVQFQASSALASNPPNGEFTSGSGTATGSRYLRLVSDTADPNSRGAIAQNLGTMVSGQVYTVTGDVFGGPGNGDLLYGAVISLVNTASITPGTTYSTQSVSGIANTAFIPNAFAVSYTATLADNGRPLVLLLRSAQAGPGQAIRGGLDNIRLTPIPEPSAALLGGIGLLGLLRRRRQT